MIIFFFCEFNLISGVIDFNVYMGNIISGNNIKLWFVDFGNVIYIVIIVICN